MLTGGSLVTVNEFYTGAFSKEAILLLSVFYWEPLSVKLQDNYRVSLAS